MGDFVPGIGKISSKYFSMDGHGEEGASANRPPFPFPQSSAAAAQAAKEQCGDFAMDSFRVSGNSKES